MKTRRKPQSVYQYEPLVTPSSWKGEERQFVVRLTQLLDQLFAQKNSASVSVDTTGMVKSVDGVKAGPDGNVPLGAVRTVNGEEPDPVTGNVEVASGNGSLDSVFNFLYPIGIIVELTVPVSPSELWGLGTWVPFMPGRVLVGAGTADSGTVYEAGETGGEETHMLTLDEMPKHNHKIYANSAGTSVYWGIGSAAQQSTNNYVTSSADGGDRPHNNMQPYGVVYRWLRTA